MLYIVTEFAKNGEMFGKSHLFFSVCWKQMVLTSRVLPPTPRLGAPTYNPTASPACPGQWLHS